VGEGRIGVTVLFIYEPLLTKLKIGMNFIAT
jgi:hypothetical protein